MENEFDAVREVAELSALVGAGKLCLISRCVLIAVNRKADVYQLVQRSNIEGSHSSCRLGLMKRRDDSLITES